MNLAKTHAYITPGAIMSMVLPDENRALFQLQPLPFKLFFALLHCIEFKTGKGETGYPSLISVMTPPYAGKGRRPEAPSRDDIKNGLRELVAAGLIWRDAALSEDKKAVFFSVRPRTWKSAAADLSTRLTTRRENGANPDEHRAKRPRQGSSYPNSYPRIQESRNYQKRGKCGQVIHSGDEGAPSPAQGEKMTPPRGLNDAPAGPTPPPEALRGSGAGHGEGSHQGPPGGQSDAPAGHAPRALCEQERAVADRVDAGSAARWRQERRERQPESVRVDDPTTWQRDENGHLILPFDHPTNRAMKQGQGLRKFSWS